MRSLPFRSFAVLATGALVFTGTCVAQDIVTPKNFTNSEAASFSNEAIGTTATPTTWLEVMDELKGTPRTIKGIAFRRDGQTTSFNNTAATVLVTAKASTAATTAATVSGTFAANHGANKATVTAFTVVQWPASSYEGPAPDLWFPIMFNTPYNFDGTGPLAVEVQVTSRTHTSSYYFDWESNTNGVSNPQSYDASFGTGCTTSTQTNPMLLTGGSQSNWPNSSVTLTYSGQRMPPSTLISMVIGTDKTNIAGLPLPLQLPGTATAPSGPCTIYTNVLLAVPALTNANGSMTFNLGFGVNPFFNGLHVYAQAAALDPVANPLGLVLSNAEVHNLVAPYGKPPIGTVSTNSASPTGTARPNQGYVVKILL